MKRFFAVVGLFAIITLSSSALACDYENSVPVNMLSNAFAAWDVVTSEMTECGNFSAVQDEEFRDKLAPAMATEPSAYTIGGISTSTIVPLLDGGLIRPLDDLVEQYAPDLNPAQLIEVDGQTVAIAMMINAQHFMYRSDIFEELGLEVPTTYDEVLAAAEVIQEAGVVDYPYGAAFQSGWNLAEEFVNMYLGFGGSFFNDDNTPSVNNEQGVAALEKLKALSAYMDPEYLSSDSAFVRQQFQQGKIAMANLWASGSSSLNDPEESQVVGLIDFAAAPAAVEGGPPATTLWWDGMVIAKNTSDEEAAAAFQLILAGISYDNLAANPEAAIWLSEEPIDSPAAIGAAASAEGGAPSYPAGTLIGLMHTALGNNVSDFLTGAESAEETLADVEAEYTAAAREAGLLE